MHASWDILPDYRYCNYAIYWGVNNGHGTGHAAMVSATTCRRGHGTGMKLVVFDPMCNYSAAKATEWIPIIPGTDGAVLLAMCNVILNDLGVWDAAYLKLKTNGPTLLGPMAGSSEIRKRQNLWSGTRATQRPRFMTMRSIADYALEGTYEVNGVECRTLISAAQRSTLNNTPLRWHRK